MEENMLKLKYNELLARYNKGAEYLAKNPNDEKAMEEFNKISDELNNIIEALPNMTNEEKTEGFNIEATVDVEVVDEPATEPIDITVTAENKNDAIVSLNNMPKNCTKTNEISQDKLDLLERSQYIKVKESNGVVIWIKFI